ncbi:MAG: hypothetical protein OXD42_14965 [Rhodospirillaceae bacterium]|nr:hypothetical protein [Rhodospirillaceae bacterium]MCY4239992.1 hypothetical protein [Rhodospirillaceae bacterium]
MLIRRQTDIPFDQDAASRQLPWIVAIMIYLSGMAIAGAIALNGLVSVWSSGLSGALTIQIPASAKLEAAHQRADAVLMIVRKTRGIQQARLLRREEVIRLVQPWLSSEAGAESLPLPLLVDARIAPGTPVDTGALADAVAKAAPGAMVENHARWAGRFVGFARSIWAVALVVVVLIGVATVITVVFSTKTGLRIHRRVISLLHLIGAHDRYIARQFERQALWLSLRGAVFGIICAVGTVFGIAYLAGKAGLAPTAGALFTPFQWALFASVPIGAAVVALLTARLTVLRTLRRMT